MNERKHLDESPEPLPPESFQPGSGDEPAIYERMIPRVLRNILVASVLFVGPAFWFYRWAGVIGFAFGAAVSYVNFHSLKRGVEGLADRIVNQNSREKGGRIVLRFVVRYGLVAVAAYAIFKSSSLAFRGFLWGLCVPVAALMAEAVWEGYVAFRRES
ncbi:MAG: ATP synthase subunit I [Acidobacteriia bacterium]|nr:ATP synthase subunit I [Terriglobia bacterium]